MAFFFGAQEMQIKTHHICTGQRLTSALAGLLSNLPGGPGRPGGWGRDSAKGKLTMAFTKSFVTGVSVGPAKPSTAVFSVRPEKKVMRWTVFMFMDQRCAAWESEMETTGTGCSGSWDNATVFFVGLREMKGQNSF